MCYMHLGLLTSTIPLMKLTIDFVNKCQVEHLPHASCCLQKHLMQTVLYLNKSATINNSMNRGVVLSDNSDRERKTLLFIVHHAIPVHETCASCYSSFATYTLQEKAASVPNVLEMLIFVSTDWLRDTRSNHSTPCCACTCTGWLPPQLDDIDDSQLLGWV